MKHVMTESVYHYVLNEILPSLKESYKECFNLLNLDALIIPTVSCTAKLIEEDKTFILNGNRVPTSRTILRNTVPSSFAGLPSVTIPAGLNKTGLPVGLELSGKPGSDRLLLIIAQQIELAIKEKQWRNR